MGSIYNGCFVLWVQRTTCSAVLAAHTSNHYDVDNTDCKSFANGSIQLTKEVGERIYHARLLAAVGPVLLRKVEDFDACLRYAHFQMQTNGNQNFSILGK